MFFSARVISAQNVRILALVGAAAMFHAIKLLE
jgi:hypothetical protein